MLESLVSPTAVPVPAESLSLEEVESLSLEEAAAAQLDPQPGWQVTHNYTVRLSDQGTVMDVLDMPWMVSDETWWWIACVVLTVFSLLVATLKYCSKIANDPRTVARHKHAITKLMHAEEDKAIRAIPKKPVEKENFIKYCEQHRKYPILFKVEFQHAGRVESHPTRHGSKACNEPKNQNQKVVPYDYNRVVLDTAPVETEPVDDAEPNYINASYVDSLLKPNAYIATQGPNERTLGDFWRMVWKERSPCIVMLTKTFDFIKVMCVQYWPVLNDKEEVYGDISVSVIKEEQLANFVIRTVRLRQQDETRLVLQFHYTEWSSHSLPFSNAILEFRRRIRISCLNNRSDDLAGPTVVHCSDGAGRTGVFMAIDANIELVEEDGEMDVYGYLKKMRQARRGLVETIDQYKFVYDALEEFLICGYSSFPVSELSQRLKEKAVKGLDKMNDYQREFNQICRQVPKFTIGDCAGGHRADNRHKNRDVMIVPPDNFRPYLSSFQGTNATDYINAVFVDEYNRAREYVVTEWPLRSTQADFWSLVYDHDCNSVVVLATPGDTSNFPHFWPESTRSKKYGAVFTVEHISHQHYQNIKSWVFKINKKESPLRKTLTPPVDPTRDAKIVSLTELMAGVKAESKTCQLFQLTCWPSTYKVPTSTNALVELMNMVERWRQRSGYGPVVVVSPDGQCRAGVYCAANACIEQVIQHSEVDVFQAVKTVRRHRPQLISNMMEYKYCYDLVLHYVLHYLNKDGTTV